MTRVAPVRRPYPLLAAALVVLLLGAGVAWGVDGALGLSHRPAAVPREDIAAAPRRAAAPAPPLAAVVVPDEIRTRKAAVAVADALVSRGLPRPVVTPAAPGPTEIRTGSPTGPRAPDLSAVTTLRAGVLDTPDPAPESYRIDVRGSELTVEGGDVAGAAGRAVPARRPDPLRRRGAARRGGRPAGHAPARPAADRRRLGGPRA
ncbi:hypothetical protein [Micromonospora fulviviridis]|uniref:Uncharacterized protein n=1 Tax=Micromonospora fulviviridis TaxID=47860 RepID=A0ABV2VTH3_9ACTN